MNYEQLTRKVCKLTHSTPLTQLNIRFIFRTRAVIITATGSLQVSVCVASWNSNVAAAGMLWCCGLYDTMQQGRWIYEEDTTSVYWYSHTKLHGMLNLDFRRMLVIDSKFRQISLRAKSTGANFVRTQKQGELLASHSGTKFRFSIVQPISDAA